MGESSWARGRFTRIGLAGALVGGLLVAGSGLAATSVVSAAGTPVSEDFSSNTYTGGVGWAGPWTEVGDNASPVDVKIEIDTSALRFQDLDSASISRTVDLSGFTEGAVFSYTLVDQGGSNFNETLSFQFRTGDGASDFTEIAETATNAPDGTRYSFVLTPAMIRANAQLRIVSGVDQSWSADEFIEIDDLLIDNPVPNPDLAAACGTDVILILDESGSIASAGAVDNVKSAVRAFVDGLVGTGSQMRITEFSNNGRNAQIGGNTAADEAFQTVNLDFKADVNEYLNGIGDNAQLATSYNPGQGQQFTNWEDGIEQAKSPGSAATGGVGAPLVVFFTDGDPNTIGFDNSPNSNGGGEDNSAAAAYAEMEALRTAGAHVLSVGVGGVTNPASFDRLAQITEPVPPVQVWDNPADPLNISTTDVLRVTDFSALENALREVVFALCAPSVTLNKVDQDGAAVPNWDFNLTVEELSGPGTDDPFVWVTPASGSTTEGSVAATKTRSTDNAGVALFQWTPNTLADPKPWDSTISFSEDLEDNWQIDPSTYAADNNNCTVKRLGAADFTVDIVKTSPAGTPGPGDVVTFKLQDNDAQTADNDFKIGKADIVSCTVKNIEPVTVRVQKVVDPDTDPGGFDLLINGVTKATDVGDGGGGASTDTEVPQGTTVMVAEVANSADLANYSPVLGCSGATLDTNTGTSGTFDAPLSAAGDVVTCTFTNTRKTADLTVDKTWVNAIVNDAVSISIDGINDDLNNPSIANGANETDADVAGTTVYAGETVAISESFTTGTAANYTSTLACSYGPNSAVIDVFNGEIVVPAAAAGADITCGFTNSRNSATLTLEKEWVDGVAGDSARLTINGANGVTATTTGGDQVSTEKATATVYAGDTVGLAEALTTPSGANYRSSLACGAQTITASGTSGTYTVGSDPDDITCRFTNTPDRGSITIIKDVTNTADGFDANIFDFTGTGGIGDFQLADNTVAGENTRTFNDLLTGDYTITETDANANGFSLVDIDCGSASTLVVDNSVTISLGADESVSCTFVNEAEGDLTITKTAVPDQVVSTGGNSFTVTYDIDVRNNGAGTTTYDLSDTPDFGTGATITAIDVTLPGGGTLAPALDPTGGTIVTGDSIAGGATETYTVTVSFDVAPTMTKTARTCVTDTAGFGTYNSATITFDGGPLSSNDCVTIPDPTPTITKSLVDGTQPVAVDGDTFTVAYDIVVANPGPGQTTYTLSDAPGFGPGTTITEITVVGPDGALPNLLVVGGTIVDTPRAIDAGVSETYTVTVTFDVAAGMTSDARTCVDATPNSGAYNAATIVFPGGGASDDACANIPAPAPTITKSLVDGTQPVAVDGDSFTVAYDIVVANPGPGQTTYTLSDAPGFGPGTTITEITVVGPDGALPNLPVVGGTIVDTPRAIDAGVSETYTVTVTFDVAADMEADARTCVDATPNSGAYNAATIAFPGGDASDDACADIPTPIITVDKTVASGPTFDAGSNSYTISYNVVVRNDGDGPGTYDLVENPTFGGGTTITSVTLDGASIAYPVTNPIVDDAPLPAGSTKTYVVEIVFTVDPGTTATARDCALEQGENGTGTLNTVTVDPNIGPNDDGADCVLIPGPTPTITKSLDGPQPVAVDGDSFTVAYDIVVANPGPGQTTYTLSDAPGFGPGTTITEITVVGPDGALPNLPVVGGTIVDTPRAIDAGVSETYTVTVTFDVAAGMTSDARTCVDATSGLGTYNAATIVFPGGDASDDACANIPVPIITTTKTVVAAPAQPVQVGAGYQYTVDYTVTATNSGDGLGTYTLVDSPSFGADVIIDSIALVDPVPASANVDFGLGDLAIVKTPAPLAPNETETFTVRATFTVPGATTEQARNCDPGAAAPNTGTFNTVTVTPNIGDPSSASDCAPIPDPNITVTKQVASGPTFDSGSGEYTISYDVVATNNGSGPGTYDLIENPTFGDPTNINITSVKLDAVPLALPIANPIVAGQEIAAGETDTYVVEITFTVDPATPATARDCTLDPGEAGTGTLNTVTVDPNIGPNDDGSACGQIPNPGIGVVKTATADPVQVGSTNQYTVDYTITVSNTGPAAGTYGLVDQPRFGAGVTVDALELVDPVPASASGTFSASDLTVVAPGADLAAGASEVFNVRATFTVPFGTPADQRDCDLGTDDGSGTYNEATVTPNIGEPSTDNACRPIPDPDIDVDKTVTTGPTYDSATGTYSISYDVVVTNAGGPGTYDVIENPTFGGGTTITAVTFDSATVALPIVNPILSGATIAEGATVTHVVTIEFTIDGSMPASERVCEPDTGDDGTGTLNTVTVDPNIGPNTEASDCEPIGDPDIEIAKTLAAGPAPIAAGSTTWTATYELQIDNVGDFGGSYDLTDDVGFATGLTVTDQQATSADIVVNGDFNDAVSNTSIATGVAIAPGEQDIVTVVVTFEFTGVVDPADLACGTDPVSGEATYNTATATPNIGPASTDDACGPLPGPDVSVDKTISSGPIDNLDGTFTIVYSIDVTNAASAGTGQYDLSDAASFSPGVTIESQAVANTAPGTITTDATFPTSGTIVTGETILPGATHTYEVTVVATLAVDTTTTYEACSSTTGAAGEGLYNEAELTVSDETITDDVCGDIAGDLQIEKTDGDIELTIGDGPFEYQLTVTNVGGASTGSPVTVTDVLPDQFEWVDFPDYCSQVDQVLTCDIDPTLVDAGGESTSFLVEAQMVDGIAESIDGYQNLSYVNSPEDPAPANPVCEPTAISSTSMDALVATPTNNVACDRTPVRPTAVIPIEPPVTTPPTTTPPTTPPPPTVPPEGLPRTGSDGSMNTLGLGALLLGLGVGLTLIVRRRHRQAWR